MKKNGRSPGARKSRGGQRKRGERPNGAAQQRGVTAARLTRSLQERRHRAAVLEALGHEVHTMFVGHGERPQWVIGDRDGSVEVANSDVVLDLAIELHARAAQEREIIRLLLERDIASLDVSDCPVADADAVGEDSGERVLDNAVHNHGKLRRPSTMREKIVHDEEVQEAQARPTSKQRTQSADGRGGPRHGGSKSAALADPHDASS